MLWGESYPIRTLSSLKSQVSTLKRSEPFLRVESSDLRLESEGSRQMRSRATQDAQSLTAGAVGHRNRRRISIVALMLAASLASTISAYATELQERTSRAYDAYLAEARQAFLSRIRTTGATVAGREGVLTARPGREDGIIDVPGGLVHHWVGTAFISGVTARKVVDVSSDYPHYSRIYKAIIASRLLGREGDTFRVLMRLKEGEAGVSAVLDVQSTVQYYYPTGRSAYVISNADEIREVKKAGESGEQLLPPGQDSGYLWRANTFSHFTEQDGGVYVEMETLGLSRRFPVMLGWLIEPIARRLGRKSVETSLHEFLAAVRTAAS
jgi:hypothetical protein